MVELTVGSNWQNLIDANQSADELFLGKSGTHTQQTAHLRPGQKLLMEDGCVVDGQFAVPIFFNAMNNNAHGAEIGSLLVGGPNPPVIHSYAPGFQDGVFKLRNNEVATVRDVLLHGFILRDCYSGTSQENGWGVDMGERTTLLRLDISGIGQAGVAWSGKVTAFQNPATAGGTIDDCDIHHNGRSGPDCGGISKQSGDSAGRVLKNSRLWGNRRANLWCDFLGWTNTGEGEGQFGQWETGFLEVFNCDFFEVDASAPQAEAVFLEVTSGVYFHHNRVFTNQSSGGSGMDGSHVIIHNGGYCIIEDNIFFDSGVHALGIQQSERYPGNGQLHTCEGIIIRRNTVYVIDTAVNNVNGIGQVAGGPPFDLVEGSNAGDWDAHLHGGNIIDENHYKVLDTRHNQLGGALFHLTGHGGDMTFADWQAEGYDVQGTYEVLSAGELPSEVPPMPSLDNDPTTGITRRVGRMGGRPNPASRSGILVPVGIQL